MKKKSKIILIVCLVILLLGGLSFLTYNLVNNRSKLTVEEKEWITQNVNKVQSVNVINNVDVFGKNGTGVFYDFIEDLEKEYNLDVNMITYNYGEDVGKQSFKIVYDLSENDTEMFKEHYVVISKNKENISNISNLTDKKIGVLSNDEKIIAKYLENISSKTIISYETSTNMFEKLDEESEIELAIVPLEENLTSILTSNYYIDFHISDLYKYVVFESNQDTFSNVVTKYYAEWSKSKQDEIYNKNELKTFVEALSISDKEMDNIQANTYNYGFVDNNPYEVLTSGTYGGIVSKYISKFSSFSNTEFNFTKYKSFNKFAEAVSNNKVDLFYNYYNLNTDYSKIDSLMNISFVVVANEANPLVVNTVSSLSGQTVYVMKNSLLENYLSTVGGINIKTYESQKELKKIAKKDNIIVLDKENYNYYHQSFLAGYNVRYTNSLSETYNFYVKSNDTLKLLLNKYMLTLDPNQMVISGTYNHTITVRSGTIIGKIAKYSIIIVILIIIVAYLTYRSTKKIKIAKKIKKEDKIKYIDQLTSLKNRNYLNENISNWNKNTIYPQATIIIDLNGLLEINDTHGYEEGDAQIKAAANVLIKTQLDNTDIMRTDGNEYLIYLVGYQEKQVVSYIRKLYKEFKNLPYENGAAIGYSMILDDMKTIEDAINESVEDMHNKKEELLNEKEK